MDGMGLERWNVGELGHHSVHSFIAADSVEQGEGKLFFGVRHANAHDHVLKGEMGSFEQRLVQGANDVSRSMFTSMEAKDSCRYKDLTSVASSKGGGLPALVMDVRGRPHGYSKVRLGPVLSGKMAASCRRRAM